jgi:hypothetical protein
VGICRMNTSDPAQFDRGPNRPDGLPLTILPLLQLLQVYASSYAGIAYHALMKPAPKIRRSYTLALMASVFVPRNL